MKICFLLGGFSENGGIGRVTSILMNDLCKEQEYDLYALSFFDAGKPAIYRLEQRIKRAHLFKEQITMKKAMMHGAVKHLKEYLAGNGIDILIACGALYYPISILACRNSAVKCICWEHSNVMNTKDHSFQSLCRGFGAKRADYVVALTKYDRKCFVDKYGIDHVVQIYNPIDEEACSVAGDYDPESKKILSVGRLSYSKNFELLIDIAADILPRNPGWTWDIYGQGVMQSQLQDRIDGYGLQEVLTLKGQVSNLYSLYNDYSMLVMTSRYEGFPMTLLEGTAFGLPMVSFDVLTGPGEIIRNGENGFLIEPFSRETMSARIDNLISDRKLRVQMSANSKKSCAQFKLDMITKQWKELFERITDGKFDRDGEASMG